MSKTKPLDREQCLRVYFKDATKCRTRKQLVADYVDAMVIASNQSLTMLEWHKRDQKIIDLLKNKGLS